MVKLLFLQCSLFLIMWSQGSAVEKIGTMSQYIHPGLVGNQVTYNFIVSHDREFVWFLVPKVGTRSILGLIKTYFTEVRNRKNANYWNRPEHACYFRFAFVRNPWDRIVSVYTNKVIGKCHGYYEECYDRDFDYFVDFIDKHPDLFYADKHIKPQLLLFPYDRMDFIGRFECFERDLSHVLKQIGIGDVSIPRKNRSEHKHYTSYYNTRTREIIAKRYAEEIEVFNYKFGEN